MTQVQTVQELFLLKQSDTNWKDINFFNLKGSRRRRGTTISETTARNNKFSDSSLLFSTDFKFVTIFKKTTENARIWNLTFHV
jgi:hypothetical protein